MLIPKTKPIRDPKWMAHLKTLPCRCCGAYGSDPAHLGHARGMGYKEGDDWCVPLCRIHHREMDTDPRGKEVWWMQNVAIPEAERAYREWEK